MGTRDGDLKKVILARIVMIVIVIVIVIVIIVIVVIVIVIIARICDDLTIYIKTKIKMIQKSLTGQT